MQDTPRGLIGWIPLTLQRYNQDHGEQHSLFIEEETESQAGKRLP